MKFEFENLPPSEEQRAICKRLSANARFRAASNYFLRLLRLLVSSAVSSALFAESG